MAWYRDIKPKRSSADRLRYASRGEGLRARKPPRIRDPRYVFYHKFCTDVWINGYKCKLITRSGIALLFEVPFQTVHSWDRAGVLPEPFIIQQRGTHAVPLYLSSQIRCLLIVIRFLVKHGYVSIPWSRLTEHMEMLHEGYDEVRRNFERRMRNDTVGDTEKRRGITFLD